MWQDVKTTSAQGGDVVSSCLGFRLYFQEEINPECSCRAAREMGMKGCWNGFHRVWQ